MSKCRRSINREAIFSCVSEGATNQAAIDEGEKDKLPEIDGINDESDNFSDIDDFEVGNKSDLVYFDIALSI